MSTWHVIERALYYQHQNTGMVSNYYWWKETCLSTKNNQWLIGDKLSKRPYWTGPWQRKVQTTTWNRRRRGCESEFFKFLWCPRWIDCTYTTYEISGSDTSWLAMTVSSQDRRISVNVVLSPFRCASTAANINCYSRMWKLSDTP